VVPLLLVQNDPDASASPTSGEHLDHHHAPAPPRAGGRSAGGATGAAHRRGTDLTAVGHDPAPATTATTSTTAGTPAPTPPAVPAQVIDDHVVSAVIPAPPTSTSTSTSTTTTTTTQPVATSAPGTTERGQVTYYAHPVGTCASPRLAFGTVVRVTNPANGLSVSCVVNDREADTARAIDLATATFAQIAPLSQGVIDAELSW
jgi:rare lipoprotein A